MIKLIIKHTINSFILSIMILMVLLPLANAQQQALDVLQTKAGLLPSNALHGIDIAIERIQLALTRNPARRAELHLQNIAERESETEIETEKDLPAAAKSELLAQKELQELQDEAEGISDAEQKKQAKELATLARQKHIEVLNRVQKKLADKGNTNAANALTQAISQQQQKISGAAPLLGKTAEEQLNKKLLEVKQSAKEKKS